jgi:hypothetical protein
VETGLQTELYVETTKTRAGKEKTPIAVR